MASQNSQQYAFRAQKSLGLVNGTPDYTPVAGFVAPDVPARTQNYSSDGRLYAYALPNVVRIFQAEGAQLLQELPLPNIVDFSFSPRGTYLSTWERPIKLEDGAQHKNLRVFSVSTGEELISFTQKSQEGWDLQYTISESHAIRLVSSEIQVFRPAEWAKGIVDKLRVEGSTLVSLSPGLNPSIAVFVAEKKGAPASIRIYSLSALSSPPTCQKTFFKADRAQIKWNTLGTQVLLLTQTEVDNSNKSYYGETGMYLLSAAGNFDCRVVLDKEGPIHDFAWSPNSKEFGVVYGYMPAKTMLFDQRVRTLHDFGSSPHNFISFNPQGRLIALAGFGNLAGKIEIFDRRTLVKVCTIDAPNTSYCAWSPDGRFLLTATLSPRLRVDNGIKIWHCSGPLMHVQLTDELYQALWRPTPVENVMPFGNGNGNGIPLAPAPSESLRSLALAGVVVVQKEGAGKPLGAYRPPGARGLATPSIFKREDEGGPSMNGAGGGAGVNGSATPPRYNRSPIPGAPGYGQQQQNGNAGGGGGGGGRRHVPGAPPPGSSGGGGGHGGASPGPDNQRSNKKRKGKKDGGAGAGAGGASTPGEEGEGAGAGVGGRSSMDQGYQQGRNNNNRENNRGGNRERGEGRERERERDQHRQQEGRGGRRGNGAGANGGGGGGVGQSTPSVPPTPTPTPPHVVVSSPTIGNDGTDGDGDGAGTPVTPGAGVAGAGGESGLDAVAKKARNLNKKLKAIEELKEKAKRGERLETTQLRKMEGEADIRRELAALGF